MATPVRAETGESVQGPEVKTELQVETPTEGTNGPVDPPKPVGRKPTPKPAAKKKTRQELNDLKIILLYMGGIYISGIILMGWFPQELLRDAAKARLRRMMAPHKKRQGLNPDEWAVQEWKRRPQNETADLLMKVNFDKARLYVYNHLIYRCSTCFLYG